jgi:uncharacterized protein
LSERALVVFARAPVRGAVKTRLAAVIGDDAALACYEAFLADSIATAADAARRTNATLELAIAGDLAHPIVTGLAAAYGATMLAQANGDLGARMGAVVDRHVEAKRAVCIVGSDSPQLAPAQLTRAFDALTAHEVAIGPSCDGGYWLLGARRKIPELLADMRWSTADVLPVTLDRLAGRSAALLEMSFDVDDADDLAFLRRWLAVAPSSVAPATRRMLAKR